MTLAASVLAVLLCAAIAYTASPTQAVTALNVRAFGATGDGRTDDTEAFKRAMRAAVNARATLYVPRGTYKMRPLDLPDGLKIKGASSTGTWLQCGVTFGSNTVVRDLKLGTFGYATHNRANASNTLFERCQFRGGSTTPASVNSNVITLGMTSESCDHITFRDCKVERNLGPSDGARSSFCNVAIVANGSSASGAYVDSITFERCHFGVSNGVAIGSPCFNFVAYTNPVSGQAYAHHGWSNVVITDSIFEAADQTTLDLADTWLQSDLTKRASGPATVSGCTFMGSGKNPALPFPNCIDIEAPRDVLIEDNTIYRCRGKAVSFGGGSGDAYGTIIRNNHFLLDQGAAPTSSSEAIHLCGDDLAFTGNDIKVDAGWFPIWLKGVSNSSFTGNTIHDTRSSPPEAGNMVVLEGTASVTVTGNTLQNGSTSNPLIYESAYGGATNVGNAISGNVFLRN